MMGSSSVEDLDEQPNDHIVSRGWQKNFANELHQVAVLDILARRVVQRDRPIKNNFAERGFMTYVSPSGEVLRDADKAFQQIERRVLNKVREVGVRSRVTDDHREAVVQLFTIHLVRSQAFRDSQFAVLNKAEPDFVRDWPKNPKLLEKYQLHLGRLPYPGEVEALVMQLWAISECRDR